MYIGDGLSFIIAPDTNQCTTDNGGCDHTCTDLIPGRMCSCNGGYILENDGETCIGEYLHNIFAQ